VDIKQINEEEVAANEFEVRALLSEILTANFSDIEGDFAGAYYDKLIVFLQNGTAILFGAFDRGQLVGILWGYEVDNFDHKRIHINMIGVKSDFRGQGVATELMHAIEHIAVLRNICELELMVNACNDRAVRCYQKGGYYVERYKMLKVLSK